MGNTYIKNAYAEQTFKKNDRRRREKKEKLKVSALESVDLMTSEAQIDELYFNVVQNVRGRDFYFPDAFNNCSNLFYTGAETTEEKIREKEELQIQKQKLLSGRLNGEAVLNEFNEQFDEVKETVPLTPEPVTQFTFSQHKRFAIMYSLFALKNKDQISKKNDFMEYLKTFLSREQKQRKKKGQEGSERAKIALDQGFQFIIALFKDVTDAATKDPSGKTLALLLKALENLHFTLKETETGALHGSDQQSFIMDANFDQARAYLVSILSHPQSPHNLASIALKIIYQIGRVRSNIEDMLVVCDLLDKHQDIDLREDLHYLKVEGEFKDEEVPQEKEQLDNFVEPAFNDEERLKRHTVHKVDSLVIPKDQFTFPLLHEKTQAVSDGTFMYLQSPSFGLLKLKIIGDTLEKVLHKPTSYNTVEMRLALADGKLFLRNLQGPTHLSDQDETGAIQLNCETLEEISLEPEQSENGDNSENNNDDGNSDSDEEEEDHGDDEEGNGDNSDRDNDDDDDSDNDNGGDEDDEGSDDEQDEDEEELNFMFLEVDTPETEKMIQETPLMSDGKHLYVISMKFTEEELEKVAEQDDPQMAQVLLQPALRLEQADPSIKGELKIIKSITLLEGDGTTPFKLGCYKDTREILTVMQAFINGELLSMRYPLNGKTHLVHFDVSTGKLNLKDSQEIDEEDKKTKLIFDPVKGLFNKLRLLEESETTKMEITKFTLAGFGKNPNSAQVTLSKDEAFISRFQKLIYSDADPEEVKKIEKQSLYANLFDRFMFQTPAILQNRALESLIYNKKTDEKTAEVMKTMILFSALKGADALKKLISKKMSKNVNKKQMVIFKYKNLTFLRGQTFELLMTQIQKYTCLLSETKSKDNLPQQYNLLYLLQIMALNLQCLDLCNNDILTLFNKDSQMVESFVRTLNQIIFPIAEETYNKDNFESESSIKNLWTDRLKNLANTFMLKSIQYMYQDKAQMLNEIHIRIDSKSEEAKSNKGEILINHLLENTDNMRRFVRGFNSHNCDVTLIIMCEALAQIKDACLQSIEKQTSKIDKKVQQLEKIMMGLIEQLIGRYSIIEDVTETKLAMGDLFIKIIEQIAQILKEVFEKVNEQVNLHLDNQPHDLNENDAKTYFEEKTDLLLKYLTKDTFFVKLFLNLLTTVTILAQTMDDNIYFNSPSSILKVREAVLSLLEPFEYFNSHILEKRKDKIPKFQEVKNESQVYTVDEFEKLSIQDQAKVVVNGGLCKQTHLEFERGVDIEELGFDVDPWTKKDNPDNFDMTCHGKRLFGYCINHDKAGCSLKYERGYIHWSYKYFFCIECTQVYKMIKKIRERQLSYELKKLPEDAPTFGLKKFNDQFSRQLCWFLGQIAGQLIIINPEKPVEEGKEEEDKKVQKEKETQNMVLNSKLLSGGMNRKFIDKVFSKKTLEFINNYSLEKQEQTPSVQSDEQFDLLSSVIQSGQNENVDKLISNLQLYLERKRPMVPSARLGGDFGLRVSRAAFGAIIKFSDLTDALFSLVDEVDLQSMNINTEQDSILQAIKSHLDFEAISKRWEQASRIRIWFQEQKKVLLDRISAEIKKENSEISTDDLDQIAYCKFEEEYQQLLNKIVEKAQFLLKLNVPNQIFTKDDEDLGPASLLQKCSCGKDHSLEDHEAHPDLKDRLHHLKTILTKQASIKPQEVQKKELFESATASVIVYLQVPIELCKVQESIEKVYIKGLLRAYGLHIIARILSVEALPKTHKQDLMNWFTSSLRGKKYQLTYYLDELKGCGAYIENQIRNQFFAVIRIILNNLKNSQDKGEIQNLLSVLQWRFFAKDHQALKQSELLRILYDQGEEVIQKSWGTKNELSESILQMFEHIMHSIIARLIKQDDKTNQETNKTELKLEKKISQVDSNATEGLLNQGFDIIFKEMSKYLQDIISPTTIDYNNFLKVRITKQILPFDFKAVKTSKACGPERNRNVKWCKLNTLSNITEMPWIKEIRVMVTTDNYIDGIHLFYELSDEIKMDQKAQQEKSPGNNGQWVSFEFEKGEYITKVSFRTGGWMDQIQFETNKGRTKKFGGEGGSRYESQMPVLPGKVARVVSFGGQHYSHMESMFVHYVEVDPIDEEADKNQDYVEFMKEKEANIKDIKTEWLLTPNQESGVAKAFIGATGIVQFVHKFENQQRKELMIQGYNEAIKQRYSQQFINRLLGVLEKYSSVASINVLKYLEPLQRPAVIKNLLTIIKMSDPKLKLQSLNILYNLIQANTPLLQFEKAVEDLKQDPSIPITKYQVESDDSQLLNFLYNYLVETRRIIWNSNQSESPGSYMVTSEIEGMLTRIITIAPQEELKRALRNKIRNFFSKPFDQWKIEEADVILSIIETSGQFMSLAAGSHVKLNQTQQHCIILGFSSYLQDCKDLKSVNTNQLKNLKLTPQVQDMNQRALLVFRGPSHDITIVDVHKLTPENCDKYLPEDPIIDVDMLSRMLEILSKKEESVTLSHIQAQILKILSQSYFKENLQEEFKKRLGDIVQVLERFNNQDQTIKETEAKFPVELLEARVTEIRTKALESPNCINGVNIITAKLSRKCNSFTFLAQQDGYASKIVIAGISESYNEATLWKALYFIEHNVTLYPDVHNNPALLFESVFQILVVDSKELDSSSENLILINAMSNSTILIFTDNLDDNSTLLTKIRNLQSPFAPPFDHKPIFVIDHESYLELNSQPQPKQIFSKTQFKQLLPNLTNKEESKEAPLKVPQTPRDEEYLKDESFIKVFQVIDVKENDPQQLVTIVEKGAGVTNLHEIVNNNKIKKNKFPETMNDKVKEMYAKIFEATFVDKNEYHSLQKQILKLRSRELMLVLSFYTGSSNGVQDQTLTESFYLTAYNDAINKKVVLGEKEPSRQIIQKLISQFSRDHSFAVKFVEESLLKSTIPMFTQLFKDTNSLKLGYYQKEIDAEKFPLPSMIYDITKQILQNEYLLDIFVQSETIISQLITFLVAFGLHQSVSNQNEQFNQCFKYLGLASKFLTSVRCNSSKFPLETLRHLCQNKFLIKLFDSKPKADSIVSKFEIPKMLIELGLEFNQIKQEVLNESGQQWYMRFILKNEYLRSRDIITYFRVLFGKTKNQQRLEAGLDVSKFVDNQDVLKNVKDIINCKDKDAIIALLTNANGSVFEKDMLLNSLVGGSDEDVEKNEFEKLAKQIIDDLPQDLTMQEVQEQCFDRSQECEQYLDGINSDVAQNASFKKILDTLKVKVQRLKFEKFGHAYKLQVNFLVMSQKIYERISTRTLKNCHPESLPYLRRKILRGLSKSYINKMVRQKINDLYNKMEDAEFEIDIYRHKAFLFIQAGKCDVEATSTIFGQIFQWSKKYPDTNKYFRQNSTDERAFRINFKAENSRDGGGPYREAMVNICHELQSSALSILAPIANNKCNHGDNRECWMINSGSESDPELFKFFGMFIGYAIRASQSLPLDLAPIFWKSLNQEVGEGLQSDAENELDLKAIDLYSYQMIENLRQCASYMTDEEFEQEVQDEKFTTTLSSGLVVQLCPGGFSMKLDKNNLQEYIRLVVNTRLGEYEQLMRHVREGVDFVIPLEICGLMSWKLLEERATGSKIIDLEKLKSITQYEGCKESDPFIQIFWKVLESFTDEERSKYLKFVWGRTRLPSQTEEFHDIQAIQYKKGAMPQSHTCFFTLDLPRYPTFEEAREKILYSVLYCGDIDGDNMDY